LSWEPAAPDELPGRVADWLADVPGVVRVAIDGAPPTDPDGFAESLRPYLHAAGRSVAHVRATTFWRDASLRLEHGREDVGSYLSWLDADALRREVLVPAVDHGRYLPSLRDPNTNRSTREPARPLPARAIVLVSGTFLLGRRLPFDRAVHLALSSAALARRTPPEQAWTLPAYDIYGRRARPERHAGMVIKLDDPRHPAVRRRCD
jgi:hypothetical protein